ncbi:MAG TPA: GSU2403 family nucleotidyltransferase fold protein [Longimicrobium sp.]|jgi:hypothetical protein|uniref:GSU2403 family nucleotidyltransferase fold protein n=1 Tax=Longimicrobium sp. TaxID=2029185 RepID=UPI002ED956A3
MTEQADLERTLRAILVELGPYRSDVVLIGGWVPYLYRHYGGFSAWGGSDSLTFELDVLVPRPLPADGRATLARLLADSGFRPDTARGPSAVWVRDLEAGEKIEFIAPHRGTAHGQGRTVTLEGQPGLGAIPLAELEVLAEHTRMLALAPAYGLPAVEVRVPTLGAYAVNKGLTFVRRHTRVDTGGAPKMVKDLVYLCDLMQGGTDVVQAITQDVEAVGRASYAHADRVRCAGTNLRFAIDGHLRHLVTDAARMVNERGNARSLAAEEYRLRGLLIDLEEILLDAAERLTRFDPVPALADEY